VDGYSGRIFGTVTYFVTTDAPSHSLGSAKSSEDGNLIDDGEFAYTWDGENP
jgi:hypothetical protein